MKDIQLVIVENEARVDSRLLSKMLQVKHKNTLELINKYRAKFERFGILAFETCKYDSVGRPEKFYLLNEDQCYFLLSLSRNTEEVVELKANLVLAFSKARKNAYKDNILQMFLLPKPMSWEKRFQADFYKALARVTNTRYTGHGHGTPFIFSQITDRWVYGVIMPSDVHKEMKARREESQKLHQWLTSGGLEALTNQINAVTMIANSSVDRVDFNARCMQVFGRKGQLALVYPNAS